MRIDELDYDLPPELIAQHPAPARDGSRLLVARAAGERPVEHRSFHELPELLAPGDLLVLNDARVLPARVHGRRASGGQLEVLFVAPLAGEPDLWRALVRPSKRVRAGEVLELNADGVAWPRRGGGEDDGAAAAPESAARWLRVEVVEALDHGERVLRFPAGVAATDWLEAHGTMPLPPYVRAEPDEARRRLDRERYQTVYAAAPGAVAAPTAGLHFTRALLDRLRSRQVEIAYLTLHVGPGTFRPVTAEHTEEHVMGAERYVLPEATATTIERARREGRRVIAVGTTTVRTLEHAAAAHGRVVPGHGAADLFITPGFRFAAVDAMITNFHLPRSTPILLVAALLGRERLLAAYGEAVARGYRFYSYGDAMLVLP